MGRARVDTALKTLLQDLGRVLVRMRDRWPDSGEWFPAAAAQVLDGMVWVRAAAPFTLLDAVAASLTPPHGRLMNRGSQVLPPFKTVTSLLSSFAHFDHLDARLLAGVYRMCSLTIECVLLRCNVLYKRSRRVLRARLSFLR